MPRIRTKKHNKTEGQYNDNVRYFKRLTKKNHDEIKKGLTEYFTELSKNISDKQSLPDNQQPLPILESLGDAYYDVASALRGEFLQRAYLDRGIEPPKKEVVNLLTYQVFQQVFESNQNNNNYCYSNSHIQSIIEYYDKAIHYYELAYKLDNDVKFTDSICFSYYHKCEACSNAVNGTDFIAKFEQSLDEFRTAVQKLPKDRQDEYAVRDGNNKSYTEAIQEFGSKLTELKQQLNASQVLVQSTFTGQQESSMDMAPDRRLSALDYLADSASEEYEKVKQVSILPTLKPSS